MEYLFLVIGIIITIVFLSKRTAKVTLDVVIIKSIASLMFIFTAAFSLINNPDFNLSAGVLILVGAFFGLMGDILLDFKYVFPKDGDTFLYWGFLSFLAGHILYAIALVLLYGFTSLSVIFCIVGFVFNAVSVPVSEKLLKLKFGKFMKITVLYIAFIGFLHNLSASHMITEHFTLHTIIFSIGMFCFLFSDVLLGPIYFSVDSKKRSSRALIVLNHALYYSAQFLIAISIALY